MPRRASLNHAILAFMLLLALSVHAAAVQENWDDGDDFRGWTFKDRCYGYNFSIAPDPATGDNLSARVENRLDECGTSEGHGHARNELSSAASSLTVYYQQDFWWCSRIYIPSNWPSSMPRPWVTVTQIIPGNRQLGWDPDFKLTIRADGTWDWDGYGGRGLGPIQRGAWTTWVIHHRRSTGSGGITEVWMNGNKVIDHRGKTTFATIEAASWKFGIYADNVPRHEQKPFVLYFDDIVTGPERCEAGGPLGPQPPPKPPTPLPPPTNLRLIGEK